MIEVHVDAEFTLPFPVFKVEAAAGGWLLVEAMQSHALSVVDPMRNIVLRVDVEHTRLETTLAPHGGFVAYTDQHSLRVFDVATGKPIREQQGKYAACRFATATTLWLVRSVSKHEASVELYDVTTWSILQETPIRDPFGDAWFSLCHQSDSGVLCWINAQQDGNRLCWILRSSTSSDPVMLEGSFDGWQPAFDSTGTKFLIVHDLHVSENAFPSGTRLGKLDWRQQVPYAAEEDDWLAAEYVAPRRALAYTGERRIFLFETDSMHITDSVTIPGHPDFRAFAQLDGERMISMHGQTDPDCSTTLAIWSKNAVAD